MRSEPHVYLYSQGEPFKETCTCERCGNAHEVVNQNRRCLYSSNVTHNLGAMALEAGIYLALWRPEEMMDPDGAKVVIGMEDAAHALADAAPQGMTDENKVEYWKLRELADVGRHALTRAHARDLIAPLRAGLALLKGDISRFEAFNAPNGWGVYKDFVPFVEKYLAACEESLDAEVEVSR